MHIKLQETRSKAEEMLSSLEIPIGKIVEVEINSTSKVRFGYCEKVKGGFRIEIVEALLQDGCEDALLEVLLHEMIHTVKGCFNHGGKFKMYCKRINEKYGTNVWTYSSADVPNHGRKYYARHVLQCVKCEHIWFYTKATQAVQHPEVCKCPYCNTKTIKRITEEYKKSAILLAAE